MIRHVVAFASGLVFAVGLAISGMTQPAKVAAFLDVTGAWDPTLAFVMVGAIAVYAIAYRVRLHRRAPLFAPEFAPLDKKRIDVRLVGGAAIFGVGWGLAGYCPGPGIASIASGNLNALTFVAAMLAGMFVVRVADRARLARAAAVS